MISNQEYKNVQKMEARCEGKIKKYTDGKAIMQNDLS